MFLFPTYLARSEIHGIGVHTAVPLPAGTRIWHFEEGVDWMIEPEALTRFPEPYQGRLRAYCYLDADSGLYVLCGDNGKYMNHSFAPNCIDPPGESTITVRDIAAGEELTCDYRMFDADSAESGLGEWDPAVLAG